jgi:DNA-binding response OmpR family regulator
MTISDKNILVVDDDPKIRNMLRNCLEGDGAIVTEASSASDVEKLLLQGVYDLVTLDINLGTDDGFEVARKIRKSSQMPIIMLTGKDDVIDRVVGLELGADDYIVKPFHVRELLARVKSVLRRTENAEACCPICHHTPCTCQKSSSTLFHFDGLTVIPDRFELRDRDSNLCELTSSEFQLLNVFLDHPKRILSRDQLMDLTGGQDWAPLDRTVDNQVARLRKKIERDPSKPSLIKTVRGIGYTLSADVHKEEDQCGSKSA